MGDSKPYLRLFAFAGVLIIVSGLVVGLFNEARAVDMAYDEPATKIDDDGTHTFTAQISVPGDQTVPIETLTAVLEQQNADRDDDIRKVNLGSASCTMEGLSTDCSASGDFETAFAPVDRIQVTGFEDGSGNSVDAGYAYGHDGDRDASRTGYGYDDVSSVFDSEGYGYGYGYETGDTTSYNLGDGYGYGYTEDAETELVIVVDITLDLDELESAAENSKEIFYLTTLAETGSDTLGTLSSPDHEFLATEQGGGGGGGGGGGDGAGIVETNLDEAFDVSANERVKIIDGFPDGFTSLLVEFNTDCDDCKIQMTSHDGGPPSGTDAVPSSFRAIEYFSIEVLDEDDNVVEGAIADGSLEFQVGQSDLDDEDPQQVVLQHKVNPWTTEETRLTSDADAAPLTYNATLSGFSEFATAVDTTPPTVSNPQPTGEISAVSPQISADFDDNRGVDADSFELAIDGTTQTSDDGELSVDEDGFEFVPAASLDTGEHTVTATIEDTSGLSTTETWTLTVAEDACDPPVAITDVQPADEATGVEPNATITVTVSEGACPVDTTTLTVNGETVEATLADGELTAELPDSVGPAETVDAEATVTDTDGNVAQRSWTFETAQETPPPDDDGGPDDGGGGALVWVIVGLVVLAVIGVGAYFYMEEQ
jgi:hypothetical protein